MERKFLEGLGLEKDVIDKVLNQNGTEITALKTQLTTKDTEISTLRSDLTSANTKIADLEKVDTEGLQKQLNAERDGRAKDKKEFTLKALLTQSGCKDIDYVLYKLGDSVEFDEKGEIKDAESFLKTTKEAYATQFAEEPAGGTGSRGNFGRQNGNKKPEEMTYTELAAYMNANPNAEF